MKRHFQILASSIFMIAFISCSKEKVERMETPGTINEEIKTARSAETRPDPLVVNLQGRFEFNGNLKEIGGRLPDGMPTYRGATKYTSDRHGNDQKALLFDGYYGVNLSNVPQQNNTSISVWLYLEWASLTELFEQSNVIFGIGPSILYFYDTFFDSYGAPDTYYHLDGGVKLSNLTNTTVQSGTDKAGWHHVAVTYDGDIIKLYMDGQLAGTKNFPGTITKSRQDYKLAYAILGNGFWAGAMDDLRFYTHTLSANEVQKIFKPVYSITI